MKEGASRSVLRGIIQYDTLNEVNIRLSDGSKAFNYEGYTNIIFKVLKADGTAYIDSEGENVIATSPVDGIVTVNLNGQATTAAGLCQSVIEIYSGEDKMTTARFNYEVFEDLDLDEAVESTAEYPALQNLLSDLSALEASIESAEGARSTAERKRVVAEALRVVAESERAEAESERVQAETERAKAEVFREDLERGYVAQAREYAKAAADSAAIAKEVAGGDFTTPTEARLIAQTCDEDCGIF